MSGSRQDNNGARSWSMRCPICGEHYMLTNWMRLPHPAQTHTVRGRAGEFQYTTDDGILVDDTHIRACDRARQEAKHGA